MDESKFRADVNRMFGVGDPIDWKKIAVELWAERDGWDGDLTGEEWNAVVSAYRQKYHIEG